MSDSEDLRKFEEEIKLYGDELPHRDYIKALSAAFERVAKNYYKTGKDSKERLERLREISDKAKEIFFDANDANLRISAGYSPNARTGEQDYVCPPGTKCVGGNCI